ncbi:putative alanine racemase family [Phaeomoniella chlamydospora]|uniref:Pyridoxal phosphate homeostasis protein n=1 Tax=Phaeomoniella chlamydospora TaxID=158046 RepID=A0A0G2G382_PHACM|nr:putative alanine racemase family [Phaeomoniella chlamydospora]
MSNADAGKSDASVPEMKLDPARVSALLENYSAVCNSVRTALPSPSSQLPRIVLVSKLKPAADVLALHRPPPSSPLPTDSVSNVPVADLPPAVHFGENYQQELLEKSKILPRTIRWHFIGGLQSNKCVALARDVRGLWAVESVDTTKKASLLDKGKGDRKAKLVEANSGDNDEEDLLNVFVQINTSGEESKSGVTPPSEENREAKELCEFILHKCPNLRLRGVMTIGAIARSKATTPETENEDFLTLKKARDTLEEQLGLKAFGDSRRLELSMGMSSDFEAAIRQGSDEVRVGTTIFGDRPPKSEAKV